MVYRWHVFTHHSTDKVSSDILSKTKEVGVGQFLAAVFLFISFGTTAEFWVVGDMHGTSYSKRNNFQPEEDGFSRTFIVRTNGKDASTTYSGVDAGGIAYKALSKNSIIRIGANSETQHVIDSWMIHPIGTVLIPKTISGYGNMGPAKAFVGRVKRKC